MLRSLVALASALAVVSAAPALAQKLDADAIARAPAVTGVSMSAEGDFLVGIVANPNSPDEKALASWDISNLTVDSKSIVLSYITPSKTMTFQGANALKQGKVIAVANQPWTGALAGCGEGRTTGATKTWVYKILLADKDIKTLDDAFAGGRTIGMGEAMQKCLEIASFPSIIDLPLDSENVIVQRTDPTSLESQYLKVNLKTKKSELLYRDIGDLSIDLIDPRDGKVRTKQKTEPSSGEYKVETYIRNEQTGEFDREDPLTVDSKERYALGVQAYDEETGKYFVVTDKFTDKAEVWLYDAKAHKFDAEPVFKHQDFDAAGVVLGRQKSNFGKILGFAYNGARSMIYWTDPTLDSIQKGLDANFKGQQVSLLDWTDGYGKVLFQADGPDHPTSYWLLVDKKKLFPIGSERPWIKPETLGKGTLVYYPARDGLQIPGLLTLPPGFKKGDPAPPAVVLPHGGPWARDTLDWDVTGWTQYLATRGYAVLQPQYRGSEGWGHKLWVAGDKEWGLKMQDDKDDGAEWMIKEGYAAKGRIAIFGYSYGGFAAFAASVRPNGPFKCAIAGAGVANLGRIGQNWSENRQQRAFQGRTVTGMDPQQNVKNLSIPIFIFHGDRDVRVPLYHSQDFYNSVKGTGKAKLLVLKDMGHQLDKWTPDNVRTSLTAIGDYLEKDCKL